MANFKITKEKIKKFEESGEKTMSQAAVSLSMFVDGNLNIDVTKSSIMSTAQFEDKFEKIKDLSTVIVFEMNQALEGNIVLTFPYADSIMLVEHMTKEEVDKDAGFTELQESALREAGNILSGAIMKIFSDHLSEMVHQSVPAFTVDTLKAALDEVMANLSLTSSHALAFQTNFTLDPLRISGSIIVLLSAESADKFLGKF